VSSLEHSKTGNERRTQLYLWVMLVVAHDSGLLLLDVFASSNAFCRCRLFQLRVREMLSTQSSFFLSSGRTVGKGKRDAEMVT